METKVRVGKEICDQKFILSALLKSKFYIKYIRLQI